MKRLMLAAVAAAALLTGVPNASAQVSVGIQIGPPPPPRAYRVPPPPGPDYEWVDGYWYADRGHWVWHDGYWTRPPYSGAYWNPPYYYEGRYYPGQWEGERGMVRHDHQWDRSRERDEGRYSREHGQGDRDDRDRDDRGHDDRGHEDRGHDRGHDRDDDHDRR